MKGGVCVGMRGVLLHPGGGRVRLEKNGKTIPPLEKASLCAFYRARSTDAASTATLQMTFDLMSLKKPHKLICTPHKL